MPRPTRHASCCSPLLLALVAACGTDAAPANESGEVVPAEAVTLLGTSEDLAEIQDVQPGPDGRVWVLNSATPFFLAFREGEGVVAAHGVRGQGPGEFRAPLTLIAGGADSGAEAGVWVYDGGRHAVVRIDDVVAPDAGGPPGAGERTVTFPRDAIPQNAALGFDPDGGPWLAPADGGFLVARNPAGLAFGLYDRALWAIELVRVDGADASVTSVLDLREVVGDPAERFGDAQFLFPVPLWTVCPDGATGVYDPLRNELRRLDAAGAQTRAVSLPAEQRVEVTPDRVFEWFFPEMMRRIPAAERPDSAEMRREFEGEFDQVRRQIGAVFPEYVALHCDARGVFWLQPMDIDGGRMGRGTAWLRIDADAVESSETLRRIRMPDGFRPRRFTDGEAWGILLDDLDIPSVARVAVP